MLLEAPIRTPSDIVAIDVNYLDHCHEQGIDQPLEPLVFGESPLTITGPRETSAWNPVEVGPEVELGVITGARWRGVTDDEALGYVFGCTVVNDISARDLQLGEGARQTGRES